MAVMGTERLDQSAAALGGAADKVLTVLRKPNAKTTSKAAPFVEIVLAGLLGFILLQISFALFAPLPAPETLPVIKPQAPAQTTAAVIGDPFRSATAPSAPIIVEETFEQDVAETSLDLVLHGTRTNPATGEGTATIRLPDQKQALFTNGDDIWQGWILRKIYPEQIIIENGGVRESLTMANRDRDTRTSPPRRSSSRVAGNQRGGAASALPGVDLAGAALIRPKFSNGGLKLELQPGGNGDLFAALGLEAGDVVVSIDNRPIGGNVPAAIERLRRLSSQSSFNIIVERNGVPIPIDVDLDILNELDDDELLN